MENIMEDMMDKSYPELPTEKFLELKRKRIRESKVDELEYGIVKDIISAYEVAEDDILPNSPFGNVNIIDEEGEKKKDDFIEWTFKDYNFAQQWDIRLKLISDMAKMFVEAKTARMIAEGLNSE